MKKQNLTELISPNDNMPVRASTITLSVGDELEADGYRFPFLDVAKSFVGTGICTFNSPTIPIIKTGTPLLIPFAYVILMVACTLKLKQRYLTSRFFCPKSFFLKIMEVLMKCKS